MSETTGTVRQVILPGQAWTAEGPYDQTGMYLMHHAFRRDLGRFVEAAAGTPVEDAATWRSLRHRWELMAEALHHHHEIEDDSLWPVLREAALRAGSTPDVELLGAMEDEHAVIDPALTAVREGFAAMVGHPCADHRSALEIRVAAVRDALARHLAHEETEALPMLQRTLTPEENRAFEKAVERAYPLRLVPFLLCWTLEGVPDEARDRLLAMAPPGYGLVQRLLRPWHRRRERRAFRWAA